MLTECPSCQTIFRVTPAILKMGHGQVRCGKCRTQFDAIECMLEDEEPAEETTQIEDNEGEAAEEAFNEVFAQEQSDEFEQAEEEPEIESDAPDSAEEITMEGDRIEISGTYRVTPEDAEDDGEQIVHKHVVIDRDLHEDDEVDDEPYVEIEMLDDATDTDEPHAEQSNPDELQIKAETPLAKRFWKRRDSNPSFDTDSSVAAATSDIDAELSALSTPQSIAPDRTKLWAAIVGVSIVALLAQVVHHYRDPLVRDPKWGGIISRVYHALGLTLTPNWDLAAYQLQQWGVVSDSSARDVLRIRASVTNSAAFSQPYPHIKLALEDRYGAVVATREFSPAEYLPSSAAANRMMAPRQRANAEIAVVDPGADAVGFFIDACLPYGGRIVCHRDQ